MAPQALRQAARSRPAADQALGSFDQLPDSAHVRLPTVATLFATSQSNVWRWVRSGRIPAPVKLGPQTTAWRVGDLRQTLATQTGRG